MTVVEEHDGHSLLNSDTENSSQGTPQPPSSISGSVRQQPPPAAQTTPIPRLTILKTDQSNWETRTKEEPPATMMSTAGSAALHTTTPSLPLDHTTTTSLSLDHRTAISLPLDHRTATSLPLDHRTATSLPLDIKPLLGSPTMPKKPKIEPGRKVSL